MRQGEVAGRVEYALLKANATENEIRALCANARRYGFHCVCVNSCWVKFCKRLLKESGVNVAATVGYPLGAASTEAKAAEARQAFQDGADEVDVVMNIGWLLSGREKDALEDLKAVVKEASARRRGKTPARLGTATRESRKAGEKRVLKVIIETAYLNERQIIAAAKLVKKSGADFVKTSTGFASRGASVKDVMLIRKAVGKKMGVKAAGGIKTLEQAMALIKAGADRLGTSAGPEIIEEARMRTD